MSHGHLPRCPVSDSQRIPLLEVLLKTEANLDELTRSERRHTAAADGPI